jgi:tetratricopeptide (TPR) repeat protein
MGVVAIVRGEPLTAIRLLPRTGQPKVLGVAYYMAGQHILFREQMAAAMRTTPADFGPYYYLGRHYDTDVDSADEAVRWFRLALERNPGFARARSYLGSCLERLGREAEAEREYRASMAAPLSRVGLARMALARGAAETALTHIEPAMKLDPRDVAAAKLAGRIYRALDRPGEAIRAMERAASLAPRDATIPYQLSRLYQATGNSDKAAMAMREFERLRAIYGTNP